MIHRTALFVFLSLSLAACQVPYYLSQGYGQLALLNSRKKIEKVLSSDQLTDAQKKKLQLAVQAREFAENTLGLAKTDNYKTYVALEKPYVTWTVSAAPKWELKHYSWDFLMVGKVPYKGFFKEESAQNEESELKNKGYDTFLRGVTAYSTLGWFDDPVLSSMLGYSENDLVNTIIHETVHATLFVKSSADFNERLATFVGNQGTESFYFAREGADSPTVKHIREELADEKLFSEFISKEIKDLADWYTKASDHNERLRVQRLRDIQDRFVKNIQPKMKTKNYENFPKIVLNNARLNVYKTYMQDLSVFERLFEKVGKDYRKFIAECKKLEKEKDPQKALEALVASAP